MMGGGGYLNPNDQARMQRFQQNHPNVQNMGGFMQRNPTIAQHAFRSGAMAQQGGAGAPLHQEAVQGLQRPPAAPGAQLNTAGMTPVARQGMRQPMRSPLRRLGR